MGFRPGAASAVALNLNGARNGPKTGAKLSTAAIDAAKANEADPLYPL